MKFYTSVFTILILAGCSESPAPQKMNQPTPSTVVRAPTPGEWKAALLGTYEESKVRDQGDGVTNFMAKFAGVPAGIDPQAMGTRDAFRKLRIYHAGFSVNVVTGVKAYISVPDNERAILFLSPYYWGKDGWLFMNKISIMVDGDVIFEKDLKDVSRETQGVGVSERADFIINSAEISALRAINNATSVIVRLSGDKGYVNLTKGKKKGQIDSNGYFVSDIQSAIAIYDVIELAIKEHCPPQQN